MKRAEHPSSYHAPHTLPTTLKNNLGRIERMGDIAASIKAMDAALPMNVVDAALHAANIRDATIRDASEGLSAETAVLSRARAGDLAAFDLLLNQYRARVLNFAFQLLRDRDEAEDLAQDAFVRAFQHLNQFRGESQLLTWLYRVTLNEGRARLRRGARRQQCAPQQPLIEEETQPLNASVPDTAQTALHKIAVERALDALSEPLRVVLLLREMHGLSYEEVARILDIPEGTVRSRLHEARKNFRLMWEEDAVGDS